MSEIPTVKELEETKRALEDLFDDNPRSAERCSLALECVEYVAAIVRSRERRFEIPWMRR